VYYLPCLERCSCNRSRGQQRRHPILSGDAENEKNIKLDGSHSLSVLNYWCPNSAGLSNSEPISVKMLQKVIPTSSPTTAFENFLVNQVTRLETYWSIKKTLATPFPPLSLFLFRSFLDRRGSQVRTKQGLLVTLSCHHCVHFQFSTVRYMFNSSHFNILRENEDLFDGSELCIRI